jgi:hypothetical protein
MKIFLLCSLISICTLTNLESQTFDILKYNWRARADSIWGSLPGSEELQNFDSVWSLIDQRFACFQNLNVDWNAIKAKYEPEVANGVSRGRYAAILGQLSLALMEPHTHINDPLMDIAKGSPGIPLLFGTTWGFDPSFGAGLTPLDDSTVLVYKTIPSHPLGLVPGDIILGYDGIPWKQLYPQLLQMELPISATSYWGGNTNAFAHTWLQSVGRNWHLFDTIDIIKYFTKDTVHLPTSLLIGKNLALFCTEQLPIPGVPMTDSITSTKDITWGIVQGTNIGYVYSWTWYNLNSHFYDAIDSLTRIYNVDGIVIDIRSNNGGYVNIADGGLRLLFQVAPPPIFLAARNNPLDHFSMTETEDFTIYVDSTRFFNKPIAVLMGQNSVSANDFIATQLRYHPKARFFGRSPASGYASPITATIDSTCYAIYAWLGGYILQDSVPHYLSHVQFQMDDSTWFTPDGVARGEDGVAEEAINWIKSVTKVDSRTSAQTPNVFVLNQNYPNPFNPSTTIGFSLPHDSRVKLEVFNTLGQRVAELVDGEFKAGFREVVWNATVASGMYFYRIEATELDNPHTQFTETKKMLLIR